MGKGVDVYKRERMWICWRRSDDWERRSEVRRVGDGSDDWKSDL